MNTFWKKELDWNELDVLFQKELLFMKKKNRRKYFREFVAKNPKISIGAKSRTLFILSFTQLIQRGRLADLKKHSFQIEGFMGASINNQTKTQKLHKKKWSKNQKKNTFQNHSLFAP